MMKMMSKIPMRDLKKVKMMVKKVKKLSILYFDFCAMLLDFIYWFQNLMVAYQGGDNDLITDKTETNLVTLRRTIYLTIQSSLDYEECAHKLLKMQLKPGQEVGCH